VWSRINQTDQTGLGRSFDAQPLWTGGPALELGHATFFTSGIVDGARYRRIPRMTYPVDGTGKVALVRDVRFYSKAAIWDGVAGWVDGGSPVTQLENAGTWVGAVTGSGTNVSIGGDPLVMSAAFTTGAMSTAGGGTGFGFQWLGAFEPGVFPEYYKQNTDGSWTPVPKSDVPRTTWLEDQTFPLAPRSGYTDLNTSAGSPWTASGFAAGPFTATLNDGSMVQYVWYKFIDQPAITRLQMSSSARQRLQAFAESLHETAGLAGPSMPAPVSGALSTLDAALIVTPPVGMEKGYVPIVISQR
jgi:hypothetical protein